MMLQFSCGVWREILHDGEIFNQRFFIFVGQKLKLRVTKTKVWSI